AHRLLKGADAPFEDEKFAYLAVVRPDVAVTAPAARVLAPPHGDKATVTLKLCGVDGALEARRVALRDKAAAKAVRHLRWGDALEA
ncbi:small ribosomal subunit Rsm22 family protein, partial [Acinetobacter baumannii]